MNDVMVPLSPFHYHYHYSPVLALPRPHRSHCSISTLLFSQAYVSCPPLPRQTSPPFLYFSSVSRDPYPRTQFHPNACAAPFPPDSNTSHPLPPLAQEDSNLTSGMIVSFSSISSLSHQLDLAPQLLTYHNGTSSPLFSHFTEWRFSLFTAFVAKLFSTPLPSTR